MSNILDYVTLWQETHVRTAKAYIDGTVIFIEHDILTERYSINITEINEEDRVASFDYNNLKRSDLDILLTLGIDTIKEGAKKTDCS